jgi:hypothetical protein
MPLYEYADPETGVKVELRRPVEARNEPIVLRRTKSVPDRVSIHGFEPTESESFDAGIVKALHRKEEREGSRFRCAEFSKAQLKKAWMETPPNE